MRRQIWKVILKTERSLTFDFGNMILSSKREVTTTGIENESNRNQIKVSSTEETIVVYDTRTRIRMSKFVRHIMK